MARNDGRIEKGQRLSSAISAKAWNRAQQAADVVLGVQPGATADGASYGSAPYQWVYAKNGTGSDLDRWGVMAITGVEVAPTSDATAAATKQFQSMPVLTGGKPSTSTTAWCVAVEPIKSNSIGRVAVSGVVQVKASDLWKSAVVRVVWKNSSWALIDLAGGTVLSKTTSTWNKGSSQELTIYAGDGGNEAAVNGSTVTAWNYVGNLPGGLWVVVARANGTFYIVSFDYTGLPSYSASAQQVLVHDTSGVLAWVDTTACT